MPDDPTPSAAEIEAFCRRWANGRLHEDMAADFAATIATLTARAEAAERARDDLAHKVLAASLERQQLEDRAEAAEDRAERLLESASALGIENARAERRAEALAARIATLEAVATNIRNIWMTRDWPKLEKAIGDLNTTLAQPKEPS